MLKLIRERRAALKAAMETLSASAVNEAGEARSLTTEEDTEFEAGLAELRKMDARIGELEDVEAREAVSAAHRVATGTVETVVAAAVVTSEPDVYRRSDHTSPSFFVDMFTIQNGREGQSEARDRMQKNGRRVAESRALGTIPANAGSQFAPPLWLVEDFVKLAAAGRVFADQLQKDVLPEGVSSINLPTVATGTSVAAQAAQNTAVSMTDLTTGSVSSGINTVAGQQVISLQLLKQSGISFDKVVVGDLARAYAIALDTQVIANVAAVAGVNAITYTQVTPTVIGAGQFYSQLVQAINAIAMNRLAPATCIVMSPRRWNWVLNAFDTQNRPLVVPNGPAFNQIATADGLGVLGAAGNILGLPVYVDPNFSTVIGGGQDQVIAMKADDLWLYETPVENASFDATYANNLSVLYRVHAFNAVIPNRYPKSISLIGGTGLAAPVW